MTQPIDYTAHVEARFVDDDDLVRTGRALVELDGLGFVHVPVPEGWEGHVSAVMDASGLVEGINADAAKIKAAADEAKAALESTGWDGDRLTVLGVTSPSLTGPRGEDGTSVRPVGTVTDSTALPDSADRGEGYVTEDTGHMWVWSGTDWVDVGPLQGPPGEPGRDGVSTWGAIEGKPDVFPPEPHSHPVGEVDGLDTALADKSDVGHRHTWDQVDEKPATFPPTIGTTPDTAAAGDHSHTAADVGAAPAEHSHPEYATTEQVADIIAAEQTVVDAAAAAVSGAVEGLIQDGLYTVPKISDRGRWEDGTVYEAGDVVTHDSARWIGAKISEIGTGRENLIVNPQFLNNRAGWSAVAGVTLTVEGTSLRLTLTTDKAIANALFVQGSDVPVATGDVISAAMMVHNPGPTPVSVRLAINTFPTPVATVSGDWVTVQAGGTVRATASGAIPAGKNGARLALQAGTGGIPTGSTLIVSQPIMEESATPGPYFDGETEGANWAGDPVSSISIIPGGTISSGPAGEPGVDTAWVLTGAVASSTAPPTQGMTAPASIPEPSSTTIYVTDLSPDGLTLLSITGWHIRTSQDEGRTWQVLSNFQTEGLPLPGTGRWLPDGEILVQTRNSGEVSRVYRSSGAATGSPTWTHVHTYTAVDQGSSHGWSWSVHGNIVLLAEYGSKAGVDNARHVYLSTDMGRSFRTIFELPNVSGLHMHGVAWDPYWDRIWITWGDDQDAWEFSDDLGETWHTAKRDDVVGAPMQAVGIYPLEDCVLFASDGYPNGLWAIPRDQGKHTGPYNPVTLLEFNAEQRITHLCHAIYQRAPGYPVLLGWGAETVPESSKIVAARSMADVTEIWTDPHTSPAGTGIRSVVGPTARGNIIWEKQDDQQSPGRLRWVTPWPGGYRR